MPSDQQAQQTQIRITNQPTGVSHGTIAGLPGQNPGEYNLMQVGGISNRMLLATQIASGILASGREIEPSDVARVSFQTVRALEHREKEELQADQAAAMKKAMMQAAAVKQSSGEGSTADKQNMVPEEEADAENIPPGA
jgi:hypothetical protein